MTFIEFVQSSPGMSPFAVEMYRVVDGQAARAGAQIMSDRELQRVASPEALERDPTGKLAATKSLRAWAASPDGIGQTWINWWVTYYSAYLDAQKAPKLVPMMAAE